MKANRIVNLTQQELISVPDIVFQEANEAGVTLIDLSHNKLAKVPSGYLRILFYYFLFQL